MQTSAYCDNCGPFKSSRLGLSMNIWWGAAPSNWKLFGFFFLLSIFAILASHMFAYQICRHTQAIKITFWKHFLSSLAARMMLTWQNLTVSSFHRRATHNNRSRDSELMSKMTTFVGQHTDVFVGLATSKLKGKVLLDKSGFLLCSTH